MRKIEKKFQYSETVITAFLMYDQVKDIAKATGKTVRTINNYKRDKELMRILSERRAEFVKTAVSKMHFSMSRVTDELLKIIDSPDTPPATKVSAINTFFSQCKDWTTISEILERLQRIEENYIQEN